ncbi:MAG: tetratricopeptide repeat protein [Chloroflexota bacterium]
MMKTRLFLISICMFLVSLWVGGCASGEDVLEVAETTVSATSTPIPATETAVPTHTSIPPTATVVPTNTPVPPTPTPQLTATPENYLELAQEHFELAETNYHDGEYETAVTEYTNALIYDPTFIAALLGRGESYLDQKAYELAIADYQQAAEIDPQAIDAYIGLGLVYFLQEEYDLARENADLALTIDENRGEPYFIRGLIHLTFEEYDLAVAELEIAVASEFKEIDYQIFVGDVLRQAYHEAAGQNVSFTVEKPTGEGWVEENDSPPEIAFVWQVEDQAIAIDVGYNYVLPRDEPLSVEFVADDYRRIEEGSMWMASLQGEFELVDVVTSTITVGEYDFYIMTYRQIYDEEKVGKPFISEGQLILYFPDDFLDFQTFQTFYVILFTNFYVQDRQTIEFTNADFLDFLATFQVTTPAE